MSIEQLALDCRAAAQPIAALSSEAKTGLLHAMADALQAHAAAILAANVEDLRRVQAKGIAAAMFDRLRLDQARLGDLANAVHRIAELPDPIGQITRSETLPNGLRVERVRIPLGVIAMIYEAR